MKRKSPKNAAMETSISYINIKSPKLRRYFSIDNFLDIFKIPLAIVQSFFYVWFFMPDIIFAKGGYTSVIPALVARIFMIPLFIHESDSVPGLANRILGKMAKKVFFLESPAARRIRKRAKPSESL